jgi:NADPH:quinone reductase
MRAVQIQQTGGPEVLAVAQVSEPRPAPGELLVSVKAAGVNFIDVYRRSGLYEVELPTIPGLEVAGVVEAVGDGVTDFSRGDRVASATVANGYAEKVCAPAAVFVPVPEAIDLEIATAAMLQGLTAHYLAISTVLLEPGMTVLCYAAAGGVGHLLVQIAANRGARVIGTVSDEDKHRLALEAGADTVIMYRDVGIAAEVMRITGGRGVDVAYDSVGANTFEASLDALRPRGTLVLYGHSSGPVPPVDPLRLMQKGSLFLTRPTLGDYIADRAELEWRAGELFEWIEQGVLEVRIDQSWPLEEAAEAHRYLEAGRTRGKLLLLP